MAAKKPRPRREPKAPVVPKVTRASRRKSTEVDELAAEAARVVADAAESIAEKAARKAGQTEHVKPSRAVRGLMDQDVVRRIKDKTKAAYREHAYKPKRQSTYRAKIREASKGIVEEALTAAGGNVARAARSLGVNRDTVYDAIGRV